MENNINRNHPRSGEIWKHFKGKLYEILAVANHTETKDLYVCYRALYGEFGYYVRPLDMFLSEVDREKYPEVEQVYRFERVEFDENWLFFLENKRLSICESLLFSDLC